MDRIREIFGRLGWLDGTLFFASRGAKRLTGHRLRIVRYRIVAQPVPEQAWVSGRSGAGFAIQRIHPGDPLTGKLPRPAEVIARRFADGAVCFAATKEDSLVGFIWLKHEHYEEDEVRCRFVPHPVAKAAWDFDVYVDPEFRKTRAFLRLWDTANAYLRERGIAWTMSRISAFHAGSQAAHRRLGAQPVAGALFLCFGPVEISFFTRRPYAWLSLGARSRPELFIDAPGRPAGNGDAADRSSRFHP
jgi:GNAT superfamily N-acetyltransferase